MASRRLVAACLAEGSGARRVPRGGFGAGLWGPGPDRMGGPDGSDGSDGLRRLPGGAFRRALQTTDPRISVRIVARKAWAGNSGGGVGTQAGRAVYQK